MTLDVEFKTKRVNGKITPFVEKKKSDAESLARYNLEDMELKKQIKRDEEYIRQCSTIDRSRLSIRYKG